jgi:CBS domain-containing membrane protein
MRNQVRKWARAWLPGQAGVNAKERWRALAGAAVGIAVTGLLCRLFADAVGNAIWLVAPLGASAVLVFALPASPLAQPWSVVGGNTLSALAGIACARWIPDPVWAGAVAVGAAIGLMLSLRCLHPPGGAAALLAVLTQTTHFSFALFPMLANSVLLVLAGVLYNTLTGRRYPHVQVAPKQAPPDARISQADIDAVLARYNQVLDISRDDLASLIQQTELEAYRRGIGTVRCSDVMSAQPVSVEFGTSLQDAWTLMQTKRIKALPVTDRINKRVIGILTQADFFHHLDLQQPEGLRSRLRDFIRNTGSMTSNKPDVVGQIMTRQVRVASADRPVVDLMTLFSEGGHHHIPIIDAERRLVGMVTQSDFVRALSRVVITPGAA